MPLTVEERRARVDAWEQALVDLTADGAASFTLGDRSLTRRNPAVIERLIRREIRIINAMESGGRYELERSRTYVDDPNALGAMENC